MISPSCIPPIYSPGLSTPEELTAAFVLRSVEFHQILSSIKGERSKTPPQHFLIRGAAGTGKTMLLLRLYFETRTDPDLKASVLTVMLDEEQYAIRTLADFWGEIVSALSREYKEFAGAMSRPDQFQTGERSPTDLLDLLRHRLRERGARLIIFLDNFVDILRRFSAEDRQLFSQTLATCAEFKVIGTTSTPPEYIRRGSHALIDFFKIIALGELTRNEAVALMHTLAESYGARHIDQILKDQPERFDVLRRIMGDTPRSVVQIFTVLARVSAASVSADLETLLDAATPYYKLRLDSLAPQEQSIMSALARSWDAMSTRSLARQLNLEGKVVASQLNQLEKKLLIRKIRTATKNHLYRIADRQLNLYFLLRPGSAGTRNQVLWFVRFLELWCRQRPDSHLPFSLFSAPPLPGKASQSEGMDTGIVPSGAPLDTAYDEVVSDVRSGKHLSAAQKLIDRGFPPAVVWSMLGDIVRDELRDFGKAESYYRIAADKGEEKALLKLALLYDTDLHSPEKAEEYFRLSTARGDPDALTHHAASYFEKRTQKQDALRIMRKAFAAAPSEENAYGLVMILLWNDEIAEATQVYRDNFANLGAQREVSWRIAQMLLMFLVKRQWQFVSAQFSENAFDIREKYRPIYFAMLSLMMETPPDEFLAMAPEFEETVAEIANEIRRVEAQEA